MAGAVYPQSRCEIRLLEDEMQAGHFGSAALLSSCVGICQAYRAERVVVINVRRQLRHLAADGPDTAEIDLFASLLMRHVRSPGDDSLYQAARAAWERIKAGG